MCVTTPREGQEHPRSVVWPCCSATGSHPIPRAGTPLQPCPHKGRFGSSNVARDVARQSWAMPRCSHIPASHPTGCTLVGSVPLPPRSVHVGAGRPGDVQGLGRDRDVLVVHGAVVVGGDVGLAGGHLHGGQAEGVYGALAEALGVETEQQVQLLLNGLHLQGWAGLSGSFPTGRGPGGSHFAPKGQ